MVEKKITLKGNRTYLSIAAIILTVLASSLGDVKMLTPEVTSGIVTLLGALAAYFRSVA